LPHNGVPSAIGNFAGHFNQSRWRSFERRGVEEPTNSNGSDSNDYAYVQSLMSGRVVEPGKFCELDCSAGRGVNINL